MIKNAYPELPVVPFESVTVPMATLIEVIKASNLPLEVQRASYIVIRNETGNGHSVVNGTNPGGVQSDSGKWPDKWDASIVATAVMQENRTGKERGFVVFDTLESGVGMICERLQARGVYIGGHTHKITNEAITTPAQLAGVYYREWVTGSATYHPNDDELNGFLSMYKQAEKIFV